MNVIQALFYFFAALTVGSATMVILARNPVRAVLFLVLTFFAMGGIWILLEAEFLAMTLVLVYVGAVMVLFLFVIMMLDIDIAALKSGFMRHLPLGIALSTVMVVTLALALTKGQWRLLQGQVQEHSASYSDVQALGELLYTHYLYPFELAAVLLLVAIVAAISLTFRGHRSGSRFQSPNEQIAVNKADRLRIIRFPKTEEHSS